MSQQPARQVRILVTGRVQGVGFRYSARSVGDSLGLDVTARNLDNGSVLIDAAGPAPAIDEFIDWARQGPLAAHVESLEIADVH